jgi:hypothetical protein
MISIEMNGRPAPWPLQRIDHGFNLSRLLRPDLFMLQILQRLSLLDKST